MCLNDQCLFFALLTYTMNDLMMGPVCVSRFETQKQPEQDFRESVKAHSGGGVLYPQAPGALMVRV